MRRGTRGRSCWRTWAARAWPGVATPLAVDELVGLAVGAGPGGGGDAPPGGAAPGHHPGEHRALRRTARRAWWISRWRRRWPRSARSSPTTPRSPGRWRTWRRSRPGGPAGRWTSAPTCTRWARRCTSWPPGAPPFGSGDPLRLTHDHLARVPVPPAEVNPAVPAPLSADHHAPAGEGAGPPLPDGRGPGLRPGAARTAESRRRPRCRVGERDVPLRLLPPSRLVGREAEVAALQAAFEDALAGRCRGVLVGGAPGVGKTALVDELRPVVTGSGRLVRGRQVRPVPAGSGVRRRSTRRSGRWAGCCWPSRRRSWPRSASGSWRRSAPNAGLLAAMVPEFAALLAVPPDPGDPLTAQVRAQRSGVAGAAGGRLAGTAGGDVRRRPAVGRAHPARLGRPGAERGAGRGPAAGGRLPRRRRGHGASAGGAAVPVAGPGRRATAAAGQPARAEPGRHGRRRCCTWTRPRRRAWPR